MSSEDDAERTGNVQKLLAERKEVKAAATGETDEGESKREIDTKHVKQNWYQAQLFAPPEINGTRAQEIYEDEYDRLKVELKDFDIKLMQMWHYKPLVFWYGLGNIREMSGEEVAAALDELDLLF